MTRWNKICKEILRTWIEKLLAYEVWREKESSWEIYSTHHFQTSNLREGYTSDFFFFQYQSFTSFFDENTPKTKHTKYFQKTILLSIRIDQPATSSIAPTMTTSISFTFGVSWIPTSYFTSSDHFIFLLVVISREL